MRSGLRRDRVVRPAKGQGAVAQGSPAATSPDPQHTQDKLPENVREHIKRLVDAAPPLSEAQRSRLALLLRPAGALGGANTR